MTSQYLTQVGILHDADYAASFARTGAYSKAWAPSRIRLELRRKGVDGADIDTALAAALGPSADLDDSFFTHQDPIGACMALLVERVDAAVEGGEGVQAALDEVAAAHDGAMRSAGALLLLPVVFVRNH